MSEPMSAMELITDEEFDELYNEILFIFNKNWITGEHKRIKELVSELIAQSRAADAKTIAELRERIAKLEKVCIKRGYWQTAPCCICGYNGPGYFQEETHKCAAKRKE